MPDAPRRRRRLVACALAALLLALGAWPWLASVSLSTEERRLVGAWRHTTPMSYGTQEVASEVVYRADRSHHYRFVDPATGSVVADWPRRGSRWRVAGGRLERRSVLDPIPYRPVKGGLVGDGGDSARIEWLGPDLIRLTYSSGASATLERVR